MTRRALIVPGLAALLAGAATAEDVKFDVSGFIDGSVFNDEQNSSGFADRDQDGIDALVNGKVILRGSYLTEGGWELGGRGEIRLQSGARSDSTPGRDDWVVAEKAYLWAESGLGRLEIGAQDGAADQLQISPPSVTKSLRIDDPLMMPVADGAGDYYRPAGLMLRTDPYASDQSLKVVYKSPRLFGLQLGISYMPEFSANFERFVKTSRPDVDQQSNIWEAGLNYDSNIDNVRVRASLVYLMGDNEHERDETVTASSPWQSVDLSEWGGGASLKYKGFTLGGAYRHSNARGGFVDHAPVVLSGGASDTEIWSIGALYEFESWKIGANYINGETNVAVEDAIGRIEKQDGDAWQVAAAYAITTDLQVSWGYQRYSFGASAGLNPLDLAEYHTANAPGSFYAGDLGADILFTEVSFGF
ncbi:MAG: porin [Alphaproteobacteria bacterium]|nr:porin [Alphaproteobacteria bacterium]